MNGPTTGECSGAAFQNNGNDITIADSNECPIFMSFYIIDIIVEMDAPKKRHQFYPTIMFITENGSLPAFAAVNRLQFVIFPRCNLGDSEYTVKFCPDQNQFLINIVKRLGPTEAVSARHRVIIVRCAQALEGGSGVEEPRLWK